MLSKTPLTTFVPGQPYIPAEPERTECLPPTPVGEWVLTCTRHELTSGVSYATPPYELITVRDSGGNIIDQYMRLCVATWVPGTGGVTEPVCTTYPAVPGQPYIAPSYTVTPTYAWDSGANSVVTRDGNVAMNLTGMGVVTGVVVGFTQDRDDVQDYARMTHAFYLHSNQDGDRLYQVMEAGTVRTANQAYTPSTAFSLRRINGAVVYVVDGTVVYRSTVPSSGELSVGTSLYGPGDVIP